MEIIAQVGLLIFTSNRFLAKENIFQKFTLHKFSDTVTFIMKHSTVQGHGGHERLNNP